MTSEFAGLFGAFHVFIEVEFTRLANDGLQALVVAWVTGVEAMVGARGFSRGFCLHTLELLLILEHTDDFEQGLGVIARFIHVLSAQPVCFQLHVAAKSADQLRAVHGRCVGNVAATGKYISGGCDNFTGDVRSTASAVVITGNVTNLVAYHTCQLFL